MRPDLFKPYAVPDDLSPFFRRFMVAFETAPTHAEFQVRATGYCHLGWVPRGRWWARLNSEMEFDSDLDGTLHLNSQVKDSDIVAGVSGPIDQVFAEFTAVGYFRLMHEPAVNRLERAFPPSTLAPWIDPILEPLRGQKPGTADTMAAMFVDCTRKLAEHALDSPRHVEAVAAALEGSKGQKKLKDIFAALPASERKLRDDFTRIVGLGPKRFARVIAVNSALGELLENRANALSDLAIDHGFFDQAHMISAFHDFLGDTPLATIRDIEPTFMRFVGQSRKTHEMGE